MKANAKRNSPKRGAGMPKRARRGGRRAVPAPKTSAIVHVAAPPERPWELSGEEITILKNSIAKGASDTELQFCLTVARRYRLDPFRRQIWFVRRWDSSADNGHGGSGAYVWTPQVGIHGLLHIAGRDHADFGSVSLPEYGPMLDVSYTSKDGKVKTFKAPEWAKVKVWKKGVAEPTEAQAWWSEYCPADLSKAPFWQKMPRRMIGKCAIALGINEAYPDLGGLHIPEQCERIDEDYTPSGRVIAEPEERGSVEAAQAVAQRKIAEYEERQKAKAETPQPPVSEGGVVPALFYTWSDESQTARVDGDKALLKQHRELLKSYWNGGEKAIIVNADQLEVLKIKFEEAGIAFRPLKAA